MNITTLNLIFWLFIIALTFVAAAFFVIPFVKIKKISIYVVLMIVVFGTLSGGLYFYLGSSADLQHYWQARNDALQVKETLAKIKDPQQIVDQLKAHLTQDPNSAEGWYLLGRLYMGMQQFPQAQLAMKKAYDLKSQNDQYAEGYAESSFFTNNHRLTPEISNLLLQLVQKNPQNVAAINLLAIDAFLQKHYQQAIEYWQKLISLFPDGSQDSQTLLMMIGRAQKQLNTQPENLLKINVAVSLADSLKNLVNDNDAVYIYALDASSPMPIAVVRKAVRDLPIQVVLSDQNVMMPGRTIEVNQIVKLTARISKHQDPMPHLGDLQSSVLKFKVTQQNNRAVLLIDQIIK